MSGFWTIYRREMASYFTSFYAYLISSVFVLITGFFFVESLTRSAVQRTIVDPAAVPEFLAFAMVFFAPLLTMRLLAEENREGTMELMLTAPISDNAIVIGKFMGAWTYFTLLVVIMILYPLILSGADIFPDQGVAVTAYIGIWLYGGACLAVGLVFSALTDSQIVAAFLSMAFLLLMWLGDLIGNVVASVELADLIRTLTLQGHYSTSFQVGIIRAEDAVFFAGMIALSLFIAIRIVESRRWR